MTSYAYPSSYYTGVSLTHFPDGSISAREDSYPLIFRIRDSDGVIALLQISRSAETIELPYVPFARQDHPPGSDLATFIRALDAQRDSPLTVRVFDPHSEALMLLMEQTQHLYLEDRAQDLFNFTTHFAQLLTEDENKPIVILPDAGAQKKYLNFFGENFYKYFGGYIQGSKHRDPETGELTNFSISDPQGFALKPNTQFLVLDDLCDGGGTFLGIAGEMEKQHVSKDRMNLYVSHGIFSKGFDLLYEAYNKIATTDSYFHKSEAPDDQLILYTLFPEEE